MDPATVWYQEPGKKIDADGVVFVENFAYLSAGRAGHDATGITSWRELENHNTTGPITQIKTDEWLPEGGFSEHVHDDMDEYFRVLEGEATFRFYTGPARVQTLIIKKGGSIYFPAGVRHEGCNNGTTPNLLLVLGVRIGMTHADDTGKGKNVIAV